MEIFFIKISGTIAIVTLVLPLRCTSEKKMGLNATLEKKSGMNHENLIYICA